MLQHLGRYEILETIAAGGQGTVYRARDSGSGRSSPQGHAPGPHR